MLVYFAIILVVLLGFCGLAIDTGRMELREDQLQAAADAGALAAAGELWHSSTMTNGQSIMQTAADADIATYETANGIASTAPSTVKLGPTYGPYTGDYSAVQVTVTQNFSTIFLGLLSHANSSITLSAKAVTQMPPCMVFLGSPPVGGTADFWVASGSANTVQDYWTCPLYVKDGTTIDGFSNYYNSQVRSSGPPSASYFGSTSVPPIYNVPPITDPLSYVTAPTLAGCINSMPVSARNQAMGTIIALVPGIYCGKTASFTPTAISCSSVVSAITPAVDIEGSYSGGCGSCVGHPTITFAPGLYVFVGGATFACATLAGTGVTMYFTKNSSVGFGQIRLEGCTWNISAPTDASNNGVPGISLMNDRSWVGTAQDFNTQYSTWYADGVIYLTGTGLYDWQTSFSAPNYLNIVASNMYIFGTSIHPATNYASLAGGNPLHTVVTLVQ